MFGFAAQDIWVTVFEGDEELGLGPDEEAIELWEARGRAERADRALPALGELLAGGPDRAVRALLGALRRPRRGTSAAPGDLPGGENERFLEYWNLVFMQYDQEPARRMGSTLTELPARNIDTGLGLNRMAAILQEKPSVFETDQFQPLIELGERAVRARLRQGARQPTARCASSPTTRAR